MNRSRAYFLVASLVVVAAVGCQRKQAEVAATPAQVAERIAQAHGGMDGWNAARSIRYEHTLIFPSAATENAPPPWVSREVVEASPQRRLYQEWTSPGGRIGWDGTNVWSLDWKIENPPRLMPFLVFYGLTAPWVSRDPGVTLEGPGLEAMPGDSTRQYVTLTLRMPRDPSRPPTSDYFKIFADPVTYEMKAVAYNVTYGPMLDLMGVPATVTQLGPITHIYDEYTTVGDLKVPTRYHTLGPDGSIAGTHEVTGWAFDQPFDEEALRTPPGAAIDTSKDERRSAS